MPATLLIVDDEKNTRAGLGLALEEDYEVYLASSADEAFNLMEAERFDVVLTDLRMAGKSGLKVIDHCLTQPHRPICIMMTAYGNVETGGGDAPQHIDFLTKPVNLEKLEMLIQRALKSRTLERKMWSCTSVWTRNTALTVSSATPRVWWTYWTKSSWWRPRRQPCCSRGRRGR